ncbi:penicillin-binding protein 1C [Xanthovirga aplysinae]|uniref:penicillin-binding protein 1C n=1 Tax=Xanthovirga aplysinae TaxID=2529853 RepID=UPI0012BCEE51|nr:penicillin-binding protein 1C [Xanthovirga aplysinae]MTI30533.1 penicillin-binding protein 1C [Xanthovirga aplysinae]
MKLIFFPPRNLKRKHFLIFLPLLSIIIWILYPLPSPLFKDPYASVLKAKDGTLLGATIADDEQWRFPIADSIPMNFEQALLHFEDEYFYKHPGINPFSLGRAIWQNMKAGKVISGASTLSMQVIRLSRKGQKRTIVEKLWEMALALKLELYYSKKQILNFYAAHAPFGGNVVGLSAASWRYFGREVDQLSWAEVATLAVLPNSPALIYPGKNSPLLKKKRDNLLEKLYQNQIIDSLTMALALDEPLPGKPYPLPQQAYHLLQRAMGEGQRGTVINSSLDPHLQRRASEIVQLHHENLRLNQIHNAAAIIIEIESGNTLAYVGNVKGSGRHGESVDIITSQRSTGSILKPFLYAAMLSEGKLLPKQLLPDFPVFFQGFAPNNFNKKFDGAVPADKALSRSLNIPFVFLLKEFRYEKLHFKLKQLGMKSLDQPASHYGLSLILGGAEVNLWELSAMYAGMGRTLRNYYRYPGEKRYRNDDVFQNHYLLTNKASIRKGTDEVGVLGASSIWYTLEAMQNLQRPDDQADWQEYSSSRPIAWKTGTSYGFRDAWAVGMDRDYVVAVWTGNASGEGRPGLLGVKTAAPLLFDLFDLLPRTSWYDFPESDTQSLLICQRSGLQATAHCQPIDTLSVPKVAIRAESCSFHKNIHLNAEGTYQVNSDCYPVHQMKEKNFFVLPAVQEWYFKPHSIWYESLPPFMPNCGQNFTKRMAFIYPKKRSRIYIPKELDGEKGRVVFEAAHREPNITLFWHLDNQFLGETKGLHQMAFVASKGKHELTLIDADGEELREWFEVVGE